MDLQLRMLIMSKIKLIIEYSFKKRLSEEHIKVSHLIAILQTSTRCTTCSGNNKSFAHRAQIMR